MKTNILRQSSFIWILAVSGFLCANVGCESMWHELQPHRIHRWNRHQPLSSSGVDAYSYNEPSSSKWTTTIVVPKTDVDAHVEQQAGFTTEIIRAQSE